MMVFFAPLSVSVVCFSIHIMLISQIFALLLLSFQDIAPYTQVIGVSIYLLNVFTLLVMFDFMKIFYLLELLNIYKLFPHRLTIPSLTALVLPALTALVLSNSTSTNPYHLSPYLYPSIDYYPCISFVSSSLNISHASLLFHSLIQLWVLPQQVLLLNLVHSRVHHQQVLLLFPYLV